MESVARVFDVDFILFDIIFAIVWILLLHKNDLRFELKFGAGGAILIFFIDAIVWYSIQGTRHVTGPIQPILFLIYFSATYGTIMFSFVAVMFKKDTFKERLPWIGVLYLGWFLSAVLSQLITIDDRVITTNREMSRVVQLIITIIGYLGLVILKETSELMQHLRWNDIVLLFAIGVTVHFGMEVSLLLSGIRPSSLKILIYNSLVEFNNGIPILYTCWILLNRYRNKRELVL